MPPASTKIVIRRDQPNGPRSQIYNDALLAQLNTVPGFHDLKGPVMGHEGSPRPHELPTGSLFLYAVEEDTMDSIREPHPIGSLCLMPIFSGTPSFRGLPDSIDKAGEIKRMIVYAEQRGKGVATKLIEAAEKIAKTEMDIEYMVVETLLILKGAQALYESAGYRDRRLFGGYVQEDSRCFEKWL